MSRPFTVANFAMSLDGRITTKDRATHAFGGPEDRDLMERLRAEADAVIIGAGTVRDENPRLQVTLPKWRNRRAELGLSSQPWPVVVSGSLDCPFEDRDLFKAVDVRKFLFTRAGHDPARLRRLGHLAEVVTVPQCDRGLDLSAVVESLSVAGVRHLLLEGGGELNFAMLSAGLIDEIYATLCPLVFGGTAPGNFSGGGFVAGEVASLELLDVRRGANDRLFLRYRCLNSLPRN